jgi:hypothetical protein
MLAQIPDSQAKQVPATLFDERDSSTEIAGLQFHER